MGEGGFDAAELHRAKENLKGRIMLSMESTSNRASRLGKSVLTDTELLSLDRICAEIDAVDAEAIAALARQLFAPERLSAAGIGPSEERFARSADGAADPAARRTLYGAARRMIRVDRSPAPPATVGERALAPGRRGRSHDIDLVARVAPSLGLDLAEALAGARRRRGRLHRSRRPRRAACEAAIAAGVPLVLGTSGLPAGDLAAPRRPRRGGRRRRLPRPQLRHRRRAHDALRGAGAARIMPACEIIELHAEH